MLSWEDDNALITAKDTNALNLSFMPLMTSNGSVYKCIANITVESLGISVMATEDFILQVIGN